MAEVPTINITIDQDALRAQVQDVIQAALREFSFNLIGAAYSINKELGKEDQAMMERAWNQGYAAHAHSVDNNEPPPNNPYGEAS